MTDADVSPATILIRLSGELALKGRRTRRRFQKRLVRNIEAAYRADGRECDVRESWSRLFVDTRGEDPAAPLRHVFGISSWSVIDGVAPADLEAIVDLGRSLYADRVVGRTFAVRARRSGSHSFNSADVMRRLGAALNPGARVDLDRPDVEVHVEVRDETAFLFSERVRGQGGLPLGVEGRAVSLLSGGFDSAVASWMLLRRGVAVDYVFCNLGGDAYLRMVAAVAKHLADRWSFGTRPRLHVLDFRPVVEEMRRVVQPAYLQVVLKRRMYLAAEAVAERLRADAVVTGEAIGQVSSQTLGNLRAIDQAASLPVLRPLVGTDKEEIVRRAREIGTYELSAAVREYCSITDGRTATAARSETLVREEGGLDPAVLAAAIESATVLDLRSLRLEALIADGLFVDEVPEDALLVDLRPPGSPDVLSDDALRIDPDELAAGFDRFDRRRTVVLVCPHGLVSAQVAERMQKAGFEAYSLRGGARRLRSAGAGTLRR